MDKEPILTKEIEAYYKLDHTCCLNTLNIKYNQIKEDDEADDRDCKNVEEMIECLNTIYEGLKKYADFEEKFGHEIRMFEGDFRALWDDHKVAKLVSEKRVNVDFLAWCAEGGHSVGTYNINIPLNDISQALTQEEFDFLIKQLIYTERD